MNNEEPAFDVLYRLPWGIFSKSDRGLIGNARTKRCYAFSSREAARRQFNQLSKVERNAAFIGKLSFTPFED